jgi:uncharacterized protein
VTVSDRPPFYGRTAALHELVGHVAAVRDSDRGRLLVVDGRPQMGKSRLLTEFVERAGLPHLYYTTPAPANPARHLQAWVGASAHSTNPPVGARTSLATPPCDWADLFGRLAGVCGNGPSIVVLDAFALAAAAEPRLEATLATLWRAELGRCPLLLVLVGRQPGAAGTDPLADQAHTLRLAPMNPAECAHALGSSAPAMKAFDTHLITGGYPRLVAGCARAGDPAHFVHAQLRDENSDLAVVAQRLIGEQVAESASARLVLGIVGSERAELTSFSRIVAQLPTAGVTAQTAATRALRLLTDTKRLVVAHSPVGAPANTKLRRYGLDDPYLRFWYTFVQPALGDIGRGRSDIASAAFDAGWAAWRAVAVAPVVRNSLRRLTLTMPELTRVDTIGGWWNREGAGVDVVMAGAKGQPLVAVGALRWREQRPFDDTERADLEKARAVVPGAERAKLAVVCPAGIGAGIDTDLVIDADTLLAAW